MKWMSYKRELCASVQERKQKRLKPNSLFEQIIQHHLALDLFRVFAFGDALGRDHREPRSMTKQCFLFGRNLPKNTLISPKKKQRYMTTASVVNSFSLSNTQRNGRSFQLYKFYYKNSIMVLLLPLRGAQ